MIDREHLWDALMTVRDHSVWAGNRFEFEIGGIVFTLKRANRDRKRGRGALSDTHFSRADGSWLVNLQYFNVQDITPMRAVEPGMLVSHSGACLREDFHLRRRTMWASNYNTADIVFEGDQAQYEQDCLFLKMYSA